MGNICPMNMTGWDILVTLGLSLLATVVAILVTLMITYRVEKVRKPVFDLKIEDNRPRLYVDGYPIGHILGDYLRVQVRNKTVLETNKRFSWVYREPAWKTTARITFLADEDEQEIGSTVGRWAGKPQPVAPSSEGDVVYEISKAGLSEYQELPPSDRWEILDVAFRICGEQEAYGWSNRNYEHHPDYKDPVTRMEQGEYIVRIELVSGEVQSVFKLRLKNIGEEFYLGELENVSH